MHLSSLRCVSASKERPFHKGPTEIRAGQVYSTQICTAKIGSFQPGSLEERRKFASTTSAGPGRALSVENRSLEVCALEIGSLQVGSHKQCSLQMCFTHIRPPKVGVSELRFPRCRLLQVHSIEDTAGESLSTAI